MTPQHAISACLDRLVAAGYRPPWTNDAGRRETARAWVDTLGDLAPEQVLAALGSWMREGQSWWPVPGVIRAAAVGTVSLDAWTRLRALLAAHPGAEPLRPGEPDPWRLGVAHEEHARWEGVVAAGGWVPRRRDDFLAGFEVYRRRVAAWSAGRHPPLLVARWRERARLGEPLTPEQVRAIAPAWHETANAGAAWDDVMRLAAEHLNPPLALDARERFALSEDRVEEEAMWNGIDAAGGIAAVRDGGDEARKRFAVGYGVRTGMVLRG